MTEKEDFSIWLQKSFALVNLYIIVAFAILCTIIICE